ncbi:uncharacterized protein LY89DRAFT_725807 [Mollisia scopiformis]|uniref:Zn(2)-C6 fungal-type domain-containing protein n=1 Tax=Mollisia scopiformis TaxID=149040 RepID=A0A132B4G4_MOLSC|nr:uncharacterized protein LY89DRAFT_725807 [Mollisia scopiformis]KUJ07292.1 hypothetical protein LY89DRAFT_725807 [Mollisia scopiformis]
MMESGQVTLTKACISCIKAKRKCSRTLPCQRCTLKQLKCRYKNPPASASGNLSISGNFQPVSANTSRRLRPLNNVPENHSAFDFSAPLSLDHLHLEFPKVILPMDRCTVSFLRNHLLRFPGTYVRSGGTVFMHPRLYQEQSLPHAPLFTTYTLCAIYTQLTSQNVHIVHQAISTTTAAVLDAISSAHTFTSHLAALQSLILLQILTLFSHTTTIPPHVRKQAEARNPLLRAMIHKLYNLAPTSLPSSMSPYQAWIVGESLRRTLHIAHMILGVHSVLNSGTFTLTLFVEALPLDKNGRMWDDVWTPTRSHGWIGGGQERGPTTSDLISYRELVDGWDGGEIKKPTLFEEMLLVACKGIDALKLA